MIRFIVNTIEMVILFKIIFSVLRFFRPTKKGKHSRKRSAGGKFTALVIDKIHYVLDEAIDKQKEKSLAQSQVQDPKSNVKSFKKYKLKKSAT